MSILEEQEKVKFQEILHGLLEEKFDDALNEVILCKLGPRRIRFVGFTEARIDFSGELHFAMVSSTPVLERASITFRGANKNFLYSPGSEEQFISV